MEPKVQTSAGLETATETVDRINTTRDAAAAAPATSSADSSIFTALQNTLLQNSGLISSQDSGIEQAVSGAIGRINEGQQAQAARINQEASEQSRNIQRSGLIQQTDAVEGRRGFATQTGVLREIMNTTNQELKDLDSRRQDLLATGEAEAASSIAQMQVKSLELAQTAKQNAVSNMINVSNSMFNFRKLQMDEEAATRENALNTISTLQNIGTLQTADSSSLRSLEKAGGLPQGTLSDIPDVPADYEIRQVGSSLLAVDPKDPTNMKVLYTTPKSVSSSVNTLSLKDTQDLGLPISLTGLSEADIVESLAGNSAPTWYRKAEEATASQSLVPEDLNKKWDSFRGALLKRTAIPDNDGEMSLADEILAAKNKGAL